MNSHKGEVAFEADGKRYVMQFNINAICILEGETGKGIVGLMGDLHDPEKMSITMLRKVLWVGLQKHHSEMTLEEAGELIPLLGGALKVREMFSESFTASFPPPDKSVRPRKAGNPRNGIGPRSTPRGAASDTNRTASGD